MRTNQFVCDVCNSVITPSNWDTYPAQLSFVIEHPGNYNFKKDDVCRDCINEFIDGVKTIMTKRK